MEGQGDYKNPLESMSLNFRGYANDVSYGAGDDPTQHFITANGRSENELNALPLPQWFHCPRTPQNYFEFLANNSTFLEKASTADVLESFPLLGSTHFEIKRELPYKNLEMASGSKPADSSPDMDVCESKPYLYDLNNDNYEASLNVRCLKQHNEGKTVNKFKSSRHQSNAQNYTSWTQVPSEGVATGAQINPRVKVGASVFLTKPDCNVSRSKASTSDRQRRMRIAERLNAIQELFPYSEKGSQAAIMEGIIDRIKYLQLQLKELSRSRLGSESTSGPFFFLEGYGHYFVAEQVMNEPLEEMMGKLLQVNPSAATKLLESKGLVVMPMALADRLQQAI